MARGSRSPASDSLHAELAAARAPDMTAAPPPELPGCELLSDIGRAFYEELWRSDSARWSTSDLYVILDSAMVHQQLCAERVVATMIPALHTHPNGMIGPHPQHALVDRLAKRLLDNYRTLGCRSRDGAKSAPSKPTAPTAVADGGNTVSFEDYLHASD